MRTHKKKRPSTFVEGRQANDAIVSAVSINSLLQKAQNVKCKEQGTHGRRSRPQTAGLAPAYH